MDENTNKNVPCKIEKNESSFESKPLKCENNGIKSEVKDLDVKTTDSTINNETKNQNNDDLSKSNCNKVLKRKVTEDGVIIERVLSEGEASSGFETVSSIDSMADMDELFLSSSIEDDSCNIIIEVKNELAFPSKNKPVGRVSDLKNRSKSSGWRSRRSDSFSKDYPNRKQNGYDCSKESKYQQRISVDKNYNYDRRDRESSERKNFDHSRQRSSNSDWSISRDQSRRLRRSREKEYESRSWQSKSNERSRRYRSSRSPERVVKNRSPERFVRKRSPERIIRNRSIERDLRRRRRSPERVRKRSSDRDVRSRSPKYKGPKIESKSSRNLDRNSTKSSPERSSPPRKKRRNSFTKLSSFSVWKRLGKSPSKTKKEEIDNIDLKRTFDSPRRKKERTPFLVELERKLKEVDSLKNVKEEPKEFKGSGSEVPPVPTLPPATNQNCSSSFPMMYMTPMPNFQGVVYPLPYAPAPAVSVNNLPLVPGPMGLPVHILPTGEQIPHDMDGRPIPVGPNGCYLPLDPTGRIYAHIVSPENQAVPIHITEDGVLRLPNSEPVPVGPEHQLPVNIDGSVIPIGPDSKPLYPCPGVPKEPPMNLMQAMNFNADEQLPKPKPPIPPLPQEESERKVETKTAETQTDDNFNIQPQATDFSLLNLIINPSDEFNKAELLKKYKKKAQEKSQNILKCKEIEKNLGVVPSKRGVKRSLPMKLSQKKSIKDDSGSSGSDMVLDSGDSDSASGSKVLGEPIKGSAEMTSHSDEEQDLLQVICDKQVPTVENLESKFEDYITEKVQRAINFLNEKNHKPPKIGRFIISDCHIVPVVYDLPNESPLWRNRIQLSFITPNFSVNDQPIVIEESPVKFTFLSQKEEKQVSAIQKTSTPKTSPVFTFDFSMQCDFTSETIQKLNVKVSKLEMEITRLKRINSNLFDDYRNVQNDRLKKSEELKKALLDIQQKDNEITSLKCSRDSAK